MVDQKKSATSKDEKAGKPVPNDSKTDAVASAARGTGYADEDGTGDGNLQADEGRQGCVPEGHHREVRRRGEADEGRRKHLLPTDQGQAGADGQEVTFHRAYCSMKGSYGSFFLLLALSRITCWQ